MASGDGGAGGSARVGAGWRWLLHWAAMLAATTSAAPAANQPDAGQSYPDHGQHPNASTGEANNKTFAAGLGVSILPTRTSVEAAAIIQPQQRSACQRFGVEAHISAENRRPGHERNGHAAQLGDHMAQHGQPQQRHQIRKAPTSITGLALGEPVEENLAVGDGRRHRQRANRPACEPPTTRRTRCQRTTALEIPCPLCWLSIATASPTAATPPSSSCPLVMILAEAALSSAAEETVPALVRGHRGHQHQWPHLIRGGRYGCFDILGRPHEQRIVERPRTSPTETASHPVQRPKRRPTHPQLEPLRASCPRRRRRAHRDGPAIAATDSWWRCSTQHRPSPSGVDTKRLLATTKPGCWRALRRNASKCEPLNCHRNPGQHQDLSRTSSRPEVERVACAAVRCTITGNDAKHTAAPANAVVSQPRDVPDLASRPEGTSSDITTPPVPDSVPPPGPADSQPMPRRGRLWVPETRSWSLTCRDAGRS